MIDIKTQKDLETMRAACKIAAGALKMAGELVAPGVSLISIDRKIKSYIESFGAKPSFLHYNGFPASACISVNDEVIHGIPDERVICDGDIVKVDVGAFLNGFHSDCANTFIAGDAPDEVRRLVDVTRQSFFDGIAGIKSGLRIGDISSAIQKTVEANGYSVVREYIGHGVGRNLHEEPDVPNFGRAGHGPRLYAGMTLAIEPMVCQGSNKLEVLDNDWTVVTCDGKLSAHYENTVVITDDGVEILTQI